MKPLADWTIEQLFSLAMLVIGIVTLFMAMNRDTNTDRERRAAHAAEQQLLSDKLDMISSMGKQTNETVQQISKQLQDHSRELARIETRIDEHDRRLHELDVKIGGTD